MLSRRLRWQVPIGRARDSIRRFKQSKRTATKSFCEVPALPYRIVIMPVDHIRYDILAQEALRGMVRNLLIDAAKKGMPGEHHFFISFDTRADGVRLSTRLREQYPE